MLLFADELDKRYLSVLYMVMKAGLRTAVTPEIIARMGDLNMKEKMRVETGCSNQRSREPW